MGGSFPIKLSKSCHLRNDQMKTNLGRHEIDQTFSIDKTNIEILVRGFLVTVHVVQFIYRILSKLYKWKEYEEQN